MYCFVLVLKTHVKIVFNHKSKTWIPTRSLISNNFYCRLVIGLYPMITSLSLLNKAPWRGLVKKSANICKVGQYSIFTSPLSTLSFTKKYLMCMCRELPVHEFLPFFNMQMVLWLSSYSVFYVIS